MSICNEYNVVEATSINNILDEAPRNINIHDMLQKSSSVLKKYNNICVSVSGGSDSDVLLDVAVKTCKRKEDLHVYFFNTGLEMAATRKHIKELESKYNIKITECRPKKNVIQACREEGIPFLSKEVSEFLYRLQSINFEFKQYTLYECLEKYCRKATADEKVILDNLFNSGKKLQIKKKVFAKRFGTYYTGQVSAIEWWCDAKGKNSKFNISAKYPFLKEFIIEHPPTFKIAANCCKYAKKDIAKELNKQHHFDLVLTGLRKSEGGVRASAYKGCITFQKTTVQYRPLFWLSNDDKDLYNNHYQITNSDCYKIYGMSRTGCSGCSCAPYKRMKEELDILKRYEPNLYKAALNVFGASYAYRKEYYEYRENEKRKLEKYKTGQMDIFDYIEQTSCVSEKNNL